MSCVSSTGQVNMDWIHKSSTPCMDTSSSVPANVPLQRQERLVCHSSSPADVDMDLREVYFLILHFLSTGPCDRTFGHLRDEILEKGLLPRRYHSWWSRSGTCTGRADDDGISFPLSYDNLVERLVFFLLTSFIVELLRRPSHTLLKCSDICHVWSIRILHAVFEGFHFSNCANYFCPSMTFVIMFIFRTGILILKRITW